jgi:hypothetical protein
MPTTTRIRSEAGDENQSPIHFPRVALSVLSFIARIDAAHSSTLSLYVIATASVARWPSIIRADSFQGFLHIRLPRYLEKWVFAKGQYRVSY